MNKNNYLKILLIFLIPAFGMLYYSGVYVLGKYDTLKNMKKITNTIKYIKYAENLLNNLQKERGLSAGFIGSKGFEFKDNLILQRKNVDKSYIKFKSYTSNNNITNIKHQSNIKQIQYEVNQIGAYRVEVDKLKMHYTVSFNNYITINNSIISSISYLISFSNSERLSNDISALMNIIKAKENAGQERAIISNYLTTKTFYPNSMYGYFIKLIALQDADIYEFLLKLDVNELKYFQTILAKKRNNNVGLYRDKIIKNYTTAYNDCNSIEWWKVSTNRINAFGLTANKIMENILYKVTIIQNNAISSLVFSLLFWIIGFIALVVTLFYLNKLVKQEKLNFKQLIKQKYIYNILSQTNEFIIHEYTEEKLFNDICKVCTKESALSLAFVGMLDKNENINIVASSGKASEYLSKLTLSADPNKTNKVLGLAGKAILENKNLIIDDIIYDGSSLFFEVAKEYNLHSAAAYPIRKFNKIVGVIVFYAKDINFFDKDIMLLFDRMINNISFGLEKIYHKKQRQEEEKQLIYKAQHDSLTNLPNRLLFLERLNYSIKTKSRTDLKGAVIFIDLDNFKPVNDNYGHHIGDLLLIKVASILKESIRHEDTVARLGGDEFIILIDHIVNNDNQTHKEILISITDKIRISIEQTHTFEDKEINISASIGVVIFPEKFKNSNEIIKASDKAMYKSKNSGKNKVVFY